MVVDAPKMQGFVELLRVIDAVVVANFENKTCFQNTSNVAKLTNDDVEIIILVRATRPRMENEGVQKRYQWPTFEKSPTV